MTVFAQVAILMAVPAILLAFITMTPRRAVVTSWVVAWLFLPNVGYSLPGLPDYTKISASAFGILLGICLFDFSRVARFRPAWYDAPMLVWCFGQFATALANAPDLTLYDGFSAFLNNVTLWGIPYFVGRLYFTDRVGQSDLAMGLVYGALVYVPLCLFEVRFSPQLQRLLYGGYVPYEGPRYGLGYRPFVFMSNGLETGMWMSSAAFVAYWLWASGSRKRLLQAPSGPVTLVLTATAILCKSVGAITQLAAAAPVFWLARRTKSPVPVLILAFVAPMYTLTRGTEVWSGRAVIDAIRPYDAERAHSFEFRLDNEDILLSKARQRPWLGWGGFNRNRVFANGRYLGITDGLWIIAVGVQGYVGLAAISLVQFLPVVLLLRRHPIRTWGEPEVAPSAAIAGVIAMYAIDNISNAMFNPIYLLMTGGLMGFSGPAGDRGGAAGEALIRRSRQLGEAGHFEEAEVYMTAAVVAAEEHAARPGAGAGGLDGLADAHVELAGLRAAVGRPADVELGLRRAIEARHVLISAEGARPESLRHLAFDLEALARHLTADRRPDEAVESWEASLALRQSLAGQYPGEETLLREWADGRNDLAWLLAAAPRPGSDDARHSVELAEAAAQCDPESHAYANTLATARYRAGDALGAAEVLTHAVALSSGGTAYDHYLIAMVSHTLGDHARAHNHFQTAERLAADLNPSADLDALRNEAIHLVGDRAAMTLARPRPHD